MMNARYPSARARFGALLSLVFVFVLAPAAPAEENGRPMDAEIAKKGAKAVDLAIHFLRERQNKDGSWNDPTGNAHPGITAMAVTCYLTCPRGYDDTDGPFTRNAIDYLLGCQKEDGSIYTKDLPGYITSISVMALVEAKRAFKNAEFVARIDAAIEKAKGYLVELQADETEGYTTSDRFYGGVGYGSSQRPDLSNTQFAMEALVEAGLPKDHPFFQKATRFLERCQNRSESNDQEWPSEDGGMVYLPGQSFAGEYTRPDGKQGLRSYGSMTYAGLKSFIHAGLEPGDPRVKAAYDWITQHYTVDENPEMGAQGLFYYYHTFARTFSALGTVEVVDAEGNAHNWRNDLVAKILTLQDTKEGELFGSWKNESDRWWEGDPVLCTTFAVLTLNRALR